MQQRFDPRSPGIRRRPPRPSRSSHNAGVARGDFSLSSTERSLPTDRHQSALCWFDCTGKMLDKLVGAPGNYRMVDHRRHGQRLCSMYLREHPDSLPSCRDKSVSRFTSDSGTETAPVGFPTE